MDRHPATQGIPSPLPRLVTRSLNFTDESMLFCTEWFLGICHKSLNTARKSCHHPLRDPGGLDLVPSALRPAIRDLLKTEGATQGFPSVVVICVHTPATQLYIYRLVFLWGVTPDASSLLPSSRILVNLFPQIYRDIFLIIFFFSSFTKLFEHMEWCKLHCTDGGGCEFFFVLIGLFITWLGWSENSTVALLCTKRHEQTGILV